MTEKTPVISVIASGINVKFWKQLHESLSKNEIDFEIIITGHIKPRFKLPPNFKHIYSETKPAQCAEISARNASGEFVMQIGDDVLFSPNHLDILLEFYNENCTDKDCISGIFKRNGSAFSIEDYKFWPGVKDSPVLPVCILLKTSLWRSLGGCDRRFIGVFWNIDLVLRLLANGGKTYLCNTCSCEEIFSKKKASIFEIYFNKIIVKLKYHLFGIRIGDGLYQEYGIQHDRPLLDSFWTKPTKDLFNTEEFYASKDGYTHLVKRKTAVEPFDNKDILNLSQSHKGRWK